MALVRSGLPDPRGVNPVAAGGALHSTLSGWLRATNIRACK
jgi:hypothetical protein